MAYIRDLVKLDQQAEFRNDVQLSHYDDPKTNLGLLKSFIFSYNAPQGMVSAVDLLDILRSAFTIARQENRMVCIANYGHGKSHLALVIANYFSKPYGSPELDKVLDKLSKAVENRSKLQRFSEFRKENREFLVIRLRGDINIGLRAQFMNQVQNALKEHTATKNERLSFWSDKALQLLDNLSPDQQSRAEEYLEAIETDLAGLRGDVRNNRDQGYDRTRELFRHLNGYLPDLGGEVSLHKLVKQIAKDYCGPGKPLSGMVILFDEFSLFVQRYAQRRAAGELQELLVGIEELGNRAVFLALSQHDPITVAKNSVASKEQAQNLEHELTRIPRKVFLYSLLESVIDAYLDQPTHSWGEFASSSQVKGPIARASNVALDLFHERYENELRWGPEKFDELVTRGAFPLHPLTTALLCNLDFAGAETIGNPRTILGFIREQVTERQEDPVIVNGQINWILPIFLVDYFKEYLGKEPFRLFEAALSKLPEDASPELERLLKALLLQNVAGIKLNRDNQENFLEEAAGIPHGIIKSHLAILVNSQCIRRDEIKRTYAFWSFSTDPDAMKKALEKTLAGKEFTWELLEGLTKYQAGSVTVDTKWGHSEDWEAREVLMTRKYFTAARLRELFPRFRIDSTGTLIEGVRGGVVWLIPETNEDVAWFHQHVEEILDQAFAGDFPLPVVVKTTSRTYANLTNAYQKLKALEAMTQSERKDAGLELYDYEVKQQTGIIHREMTLLRGEKFNFMNIPHKVSNYILPAAYRELVSLSQSPTIEQVLKECYQLAYRFAPPEFFTQYKNPARGSNNLWKATVLLSTLLLNNEIYSGQISLRTNKIAQDCLQKFLINKWKIVSVDFRIQESSNGNVSKAWAVLDKTFKPGIKSVYVRDPLVELLNPPFGYDYNTLTLLLSAWIGYHRHELQFTSMGVATNIDGLIGLVEEATGKKTFIGEICGPQKVSISRRDFGELIREATQLIERVNKETFTQKQAVEVSAKLLVISQDVGIPDETRTAAKNAADRLIAGRDTANSYDQAAKAIRSEVEHGKNIQTFINLKKRITELPHSELVKPEEKPITELDSAWREGLHRLVDVECKRLVDVTRLQDVGLCQNKLEEMKNQLRNAKLEKQADRVKLALEDLKKKEEELVAQEQEAPVQAQIKAMDRRLPLNVLFGYIDYLQKLDRLSKNTMQLRDQRLKELQTEAGQLEQLAKSLSEGIIEIDSVEAAEQWRTTCMQSFVRFENTQYEDKLITARDQVAQIQNFLMNLRAIERRQIRSLDEAVELIRQLEELRTETSSWLPVKAAKNLDSVQQRIKQIGQQRVEVAHQWLRNLQSLYDKGEPLSKVVRELEVEQPYLSPTDRDQLQQLRVKVQRKQEDDVLARIETEFCKIANPVLQQKCINRLQQILSETQKTGSVL